MISYIGTCWVELINTGGPFANLSAGMYVLLANA